MGKVVVDGGEMGTNGSMRVLNGTVEMVDGGEVGTDESTRVLNGTVEMVDGANVKTPRPKSTLPRPEWYLSESEDENGEAEEKAMPFAMIPPMTGTPEEEGDNAEVSSDGGVSDSKVIFPEKGANGAAEGGDWPPADAAGMVSTDWAGHQDTDVWHEHYDAPPGPEVLLGLRRESEGLKAGDARDAWRWDREHLRAFGKHVKEKMQVGEAERRAARNGTTRSERRKMRRKKFRSFLRTKKIPLASTAIGMGAGFTVAAALSVGGGMAAAGVAAGGGITAAGIAAGVVTGVIGSVIQGVARQSLQDRASGIVHQMPRNAAELRTSMKYRARDAILPALGGAVSGVVGGTVGPKLAIGVRRLIGGAGAQLQHMGVPSRLIQASAVHISTSALNTASSQVVQSVVRTGFDNAT